MNWPDGSREEVRVVQVAGPMIQVERTQFLGDDDCLICVNTNWIEWS